MTDIRMAIVSTRSCKLEISSNQILLTNLKAHPFAVNRTAITLPNTKSLLTLYGVQSS